ncbi:UDP-glucose dehydrogenase family protein [Lutispora sp.]|uniref:UDP-glucose dehydrogenase family protein n=1 Tax=Lutispora sp. TaxID=2828727 RepID=UPI002B212B63|nr:UDP-glucose/GDP-mannose dehydrogenase family protein [Lutispora sp.]MEA4962023.1 UDP-glucose/GDP-mannose dehydrogenase family protein [Lutispora sp.]
MNISIIGTGYVGLVTGVCLAYKGHKVFCADKQQHIIDSISRGVSPIYEQQLDSMLAHVIKNNDLKATTDLNQAVMESEITIIAVGTPYIGDQIALTYIKEAAHEVGAILKNKKDYHVVCVKSTVVPTTTDTIVLPILKQASGKELGDFGLVMNPEFLKEGEAVQDFLNPDRIIIGAIDEKSYEVFKNIYQYHFDAPIIKVNPRTAEMIKYASNSLLATLISFSNEIAAISEEAGGIDALKVMESVGLDKRFTPKVRGQLIKPDATKYLKPGRGFGGSCFPKDIKSLISFSVQRGYDPKILKSVIAVNELQIKRILCTLKKELSGIQDKTIAILGLAFKANTDDVRESQSIKLIRELKEAGTKLKCYDPAAVEKAKTELLGCDGVEFFNDYREALEGTDAAILMTDWEFITSIPFSEYVKFMKAPAVFDCCRALDHAKAKFYGVKYIGIGFRE